MGPACAAAELAARHPFLYHLTTPGAWGSIARHGLLPADGLARLFETDPAAAELLLSAPRAREVPITHPKFGTAVLNDNSPLRSAGLASCLDDGLTPADWLAMLNARVFFWADARGLGTLSGARLNRGRGREVLVVDTLGLARAHGARMELSPINSGATLRRPARRGLSTFTPLGATTLAAWRRRRGMRTPDRVVEVTVRGGVMDIERHVLEVRRVGAD